MVSLYMVMLLHIHKSIHVSTKFTTQANFTGHLDKARRIRKFSPHIDMNMAVWHTSTQKLTLYKFHQWVECISEYSNIVSATISEHGNNAYWPI